MGKDNFTKRTIEALPVPPKKEAKDGTLKTISVLHHDTKTPGLCVAVSSSGRKAFLSYRSVAGSM